MVMGGRDRPVLRNVLELGRWALRGAVVVMATYAACRVGPPIFPQAGLDQADGTMPGPWHPEQVCPDVPLSAQERVLLRELDLEFD
jgi:hypothetical protein